MIADIVDFNEENVYKKGHIIPNMQVIANIIDHIIIVTLDKAIAVSLNTTYNRMNNIIINNNSCIK